MKRYNQASNLAIVCPITKQAKGYPFEIALPSECNLFGVVLVDQIKSVGWRVRNALFIEKAPLRLIDEIRAILRPALDG